MASEKKTKKNEKLKKLWAELGDIEFAVEPKKNIEISADLVKHFKPNSQLVKEVNSHDS